MLRSDFSGGVQNADTSSLSVAQSSTRVSSSRYAPVVSTTKPPVVQTQEPLQPLVQTPVIQPQEPSPPIIQYDT